MGERTRNFDWSKTPLGSPGQWPPGLRTSVSILLNSQFPMFVWWGKELTTIYNDAYKIMAGDKHPNLLGKSGEEAWAEAWKDLAPLVENVFNGISTWSEDLVLYIDRNNFIEEAYFTFSYSPVLDESGNVGGLFCAVIETTEKVISKKKTEASERNFRNTILQAPVAICILRGPDAVVEIANEMMAELLGKSAEELVGNSLFTAVPEVKEDGLQDLLQQVRTTGETYKAYGVSFTLPRRDGPQEVYVDFVYEAYREEDGSISGVIVVAIDVTTQIIAHKKIKDSEADLQHRVEERTEELAASNEELTAAGEDLVAANQQLEEVNFLLKQNNRELEEFAYIASHDLQEPLRKVSTFTEMLRMHLGPVDKRSNNYFDKITTSTQRMINLIRDVLDFSQLSGQRQVFEPVNLSAVIEALTADFELTIEQKGAVIQYANLPAITANALQMRQLFANLLSNALKFTRDGVPPLITVSASPLTDTEKAAHKDLLTQVDYCLILVQDNGIGFSEEHAEKIFRIFQRLHGKTDFAGTGIGLALCKKIALNHHGEIWAVSQAGQGASFYIALPLRQD